MDQIDAVRAFIEVAERESFTAAADRLGLSKALVSKHVAALETRAGARLLNRTTRRVSLTETGAAFLDAARGAVTAWEAMMEAAAEDQDQPTGLLRVAGPRVFGEAVLADLVAEFMAAQPNLRVDLALEERRVDVVGEGFDLAIRMGAPEQSSLIAVRLCDWPLVFCAAPAYLAARGTPRTPEDLADHDCVVSAAFAPAGQWALYREDAVMRIAPRARAKTNNDPAAAALVRAGVGVGLIMRRPVEADLAAGRLVEVLAPFSRRERAVHALIPHRSHMPRKTRLLLDHLKARLNDR
jgi:DNA-binding transcriptional LysR family regulator